MESATLGSYMVTPSQKPRSSIWHSDVCSEENPDEVIAPAYADDAGDVDISRSARIPMWIANWGDMHVGFAKAILRELSPVVFSRHRCEPPSSRPISARCRATRR